MTQERDRVLDADLRVRARRATNLRRADVGMLMVFVRASDRRGNESNREYGRGEPEPKRAHMTTRSDAPEVRFDLNVSGIPCAMGHSLSPRNRALSARRRISSISALCVQVLGAASSARS